MLKHSPLDAHHRARGAKMVGFGGWEMPLSYPHGTLAEHMVCRKEAAAFDVSHLGTVRVEGPGSFERLQGALCNDLGRVAPGRAQYTQLLDEGDGSVVDDIIVWWVDEQAFDVMPNASNTDAVLAAIGGQDTTDTRAVIAIQGPLARSVVERVCPEAAAVRRFGVARFMWQGSPCLAAGTGYTGEDGVECAVPASVAGEFWEAMLDAGAQPAGLGARDTLRLEAGLPLHGHELGPGISPLQAGLGWVVGWDKPAFRGKEALIAERARGVTRILRGLVAQGRQPLRAEQEVLLDGREAGRITSGNYSPVLGRGIALALLDPAIGTGTSVSVAGRGREIAAKVTALPFVKAGTAAS